MILRAMPNSIVVGSPTAGADGNITKIFFSNDLSAGFTSLGVFYPDGKQTQRIGIIPDSVVYQTIQGIRQGRDEVFEKAMEIAGCIVSVSDNELPKSEFSVYPNPAADFIEISVEPQSPLPYIRIFNVFGEELLNISNLNNSQFRISVSGLPSGIYFVREGYRVGKFVKI